MKNIKLENGKIVSISDESYKALSDSITEDFEINNDSAVCDYKHNYRLEDNQKKIKTTIRKSKQVYVNQVFAEHSVFGDSCVFIKCRFGSYCEFGADCEFDSCSKFGSYCDFGSYSKFGPYCEFGSSCKFGPGCKRLTPYWDENGKHE